MEIESITPLLIFETSSLRCVLCYCLYFYLRIKSASGIIKKLLLRSNTMWNVFGISKEMKWDVAFIQKHEVHFELQMIIEILYWSMWKKKIIIIIFQNIYINILSDTYVSLCKVYLGVSFQRIEHVWELEENLTVWFTVILSVSFCLHVWYKVILFNDLFQ